MPVSTDHLQEEIEELKSRVDELTRRLAALWPGSLDAWLKTAPPKDAADCFGVLGGKLNMSLEEIRAFEYGREPVNGDAPSGGRV